MAAVAMDRAAGGSVKARPPRLSALGRDGCLYNVGVFTVNAFICHFLLERWDSVSWYLSGSARLLSRAKVFSAAHHLGLLADPSSRNAIQGLRSLSRHSKGQQLAYDANTWAGELADAETRYGSAVEAVMLWASASSGSLAMRPFLLR